MRAPESLVLPNPDQISVSLPVTAFRIGESVAPALLRSLLDKGLDQSAQMAYLRWQRPKKKHTVPALYQNRRKILDVQIAKSLGVFLDVQPKKSDLGKLIGKRFESITVLTTRATPLCTQAYHRKTIDRRLRVRRIRLTHTNSKPVRDYRLMPYCDCATFPSTSNNGILWKKQLAEPATASQRSKKARPHISVSNHAKDIGQSLRGSFQQFRDRLFDATRLILGYPVIRGRMKPLCWILRNR